MKSYLSNVVRSEPIRLILFFLVIELITIGINIPSLGYYYDDWYLLWSGASRGVDSIIPLFSTDRPFMGYLYSGTYSLLGQTALYWHIFAFCLRFLGGLGFYWIVRMVFPGSKSLAITSTVLFLVYPGFLSQPDAATKQNHLLGYACALYSIAFTLNAIRARTTFTKILNILASAFLAIGYLFIYEYMIGLEAMRIFLAFIIIDQDKPELWRYKVRQFFRVWFPIPILVGGFLYWRLFIFESTRAATNVTRLAGGYVSEFRPMVYRLVFETGKDLLDTLIFAWFSKAYSLFAMADYTDLFLALLFGAVVSVLLIVCLRSPLTADESIKNSPTTAKTLLMLGGSITLFAILPVIVSGREFVPTDAYKSYGLHVTAGVGLFVTGVWLFFKANYKYYFLIFLVSLSVSTQYLNGVQWAQFWEAERQVWWQLSWRAPNLEDDTLVMAFLPEGMQFQQDYENWGPVNLIYRPGNAIQPAIQGEVLLQDSIFAIEKQEITTRLVRDIPLDQNFTKLLLLSYPSVRSCLHVIDGVFPNLSSAEPLPVQKVASYSKIGQILVDAPGAIPPEQLFGKEPEKGWCYYYQTASLMAQKKDWRSISNLYDTVKLEKIEPADSTEWMPFILGLANTDRIPDAKKVFRQYLKEDKWFTFHSCLTLENMKHDPMTTIFDGERLENILCE